MRARAKLAAWVAIAMALCLVTAPTFPTLVNDSTGDAFGGLFVAIPISALLVLIFALRWKEFAFALDQEGGRHLWVLRLAGVSAIAGLAALEPLSSQSLAASGVALAVTFYSSSLVIVPSASRFMLPYAVVYAAAAGAPAVLLWVFGGPLAALNTGISAKLSSVAGFPVLWQGTQFEILAKSGGLVKGVVTPSCSSVTSMTTFLGLLALMHLDLKKDWRGTVKIAAIGMLALILLDSLRILFLLWVGYEYGADSLWGLHDWLGYALFLGCFLSVRPAYARMPRSAGTPGTLPGDEPPTLGTKGPLAP